MKIRMIAMVAVLALSAQAGAFDIKGKWKSVTDKLEGATDSAAESMGGDTSKKTEDQPLDLDEHSVYNQPNIELKDSPDKKAKNPK